MMSSIGSGSSSSANLSRMLSRLDTDSSGSISKNEFVSGRPKGASEDQSSTLFDALDSSGTGSMSVNDLVSAFQSMSSTMQGAMLQAQEQAGGRGSGRGGPDPSEMFSRLDEDDDGTLTKEEFLAGKPDDVSDEQAQELWSQIAGDNADSASKEQFAKGIGSGAGPHGGPPPGGAPDPTELFSKLDTDGDGTVTQEEFLAGKPDDVSNDQANQLWEQISSGSSDGVTQDQFVQGMASAKPPTADAATGLSANEVTDDLIQQLLAAIDTYRNTIKVQADTSATGLLTSIAA